jgi:hypothetical protein
VIRPQGSARRGWIAHLDPHDGSRATHYAQVARQGTRFGFLQSALGA